MFQIQSKLNEQNCLLGVLIMVSVDNLSNCRLLQNKKDSIENGIRAKYDSVSRKALKEIYPLDVYSTYYKKFGYTYHVLPQVESIVRGKSIPSINPLVEAMFMVELKNMLLTAGHDLEKVEPPLSLEISSGENSYTGMNGKDINTVEDDFMVKDNQSVISSILRGPDRRTCITEGTSQVLFTVYAPEGIKENTVYNHLDDIESYVRIFSPKADTRMKKVI